MGKEQIWATPSEAYFFKHSSRFQGKFLESFIFNDSEIFYGLEARRIRREGDALSRQIEFLISASKELEAEKICPFCKTRKIKFLLFLNYTILDLKLSCCDDAVCKEALKSGRPESRLIPLDLNGLRQFRGRTVSKTMRKKAELLFRQVFGFKKNASPLEIFDKFNQAYLKSQELRSKNSLGKSSGESSGKSSGKSSSLNSDSKLDSEIKFESSQSKAEKPTSREEIPFRTRYSAKKIDPNQTKLFS